MSDMNAMFIGGLLGAVVAAEYGKGGAEWNAFQNLIMSSIHELSGALSSASFIIGRAAYVTRNGVERLGEGISEGHVPSGAIIDKSDWDSTIDAGMRVTEFVLRGGQLAIQAILEGARIAASRLLFAAEETKDSVVRKLPYTGEAFSSLYGEFLKGYKGTGAGSYSYPPYSTTSAPVRTGFWGSPAQEHTGFWGSPAQERPAEERQGFWGSSPSERPPQERQGFWGSPAQERQGFWGAPPQEAQERQGYYTSPPQDRQGFYQARTASEKPTQWQREQPREQPPEQREPIRLPWFLGGEAPAREQRETQYTARSYNPQRTTSDGPQGTTSQSDPYQGASFLSLF